jgi:chorismate synthase
MGGNSFGGLFRITTFGESHGEALGVVVDGCPAGLELAVADIQPELDRRRPGQSGITTSRGEGDVVEILSGVFEGRTTGAPIALLIRNKDAAPGDYIHLKDLYRPSHADFTYAEKYGVRDWRGSGRASARETVARVAAGAVAKKALQVSCGVEILAFVSQVEDLVATVDTRSVTLAEVEKNLVRCPDTAVAQRMLERIEAVRAAGDSVGGVVSCVIRNAPVGLGEPVFDKLHADLAKAMLSINAVKGFEIGEGFRAAAMRGSAHNDPFVKTPQGVRPATNRSGGVLGGISTGEPIEFRVAFKPVATIKMAQDTTTATGEGVTLEARGRHDPCVVPRAVPIVEAMAALVLLDQYLRARASARLFSPGA